jgi:hypothetical protein
VTHLRKMMLEELQRRNYSQTTTRTYLRAVSPRPGTPPAESLNSPSTSRVMISVVPLTRLRTALHSRAG